MREICIHLDNHLIVGIQRMAKPVAVCSAQACLAGTVKNLDASQLGCHRIGNTTRTVWAVVITDNHMQIWAKIPNGLEQAPNVLGLLVCGDHKGSLHVETVPLGDALPCFAWLGLAELPS
jgi:hypothetical protein